MNILIKILIVALLLVAIYFQVFARENAFDLWLTFKSRFTTAHLPYLLIVILLVPINWGFETYKFRTLIRDFSDLNFWQTYRSILAGITVSLFTPNRIGEVGGRVLLVKPENNWKAVVATMVGSLSQLIVLLSVGFLGAIYFVFNFVQADFKGVEWMLAGGVILVGILIYGFFNLKKLIPLAQKLPYYNWFKKRFKDLKVLLHYNHQQLFIALLFSLFRYLTYSFQYFLMLHFFGIEVPFAAAISGIATIFLLQTSIPLPPVVGLLARGEIALGVWGIFSALSLNILAASFSLFVINLTLPALIGAFFITKINVLKSLGYGKENKSSSK
ncbi:MAG: lysylphosphatidylglycerol synthase domain-containing protein [Saprospiraceae bacterium]